MGRFDTLDQFPHRYYSRIAGLPLLPPVHPPPGHRGSDGDLGVLSETQTLFLLFGFGSSLLKASLCFSQEAIPKDCCNFLFNVFSG